MAQVDGTLLKRLLQRWLANRWLCWGAGPLLSLHVGAVLPIVVLELARAAGWLNKQHLIEYKKDGGVGRDEMVKRTRARISFWAQLRGGLLTIGPHAFANALLAVILLPRVFRGKATRTFPNLSSFAAVVALMHIASDFGLYWGHRLQHEIPFLWKYCHSYHHRLETPTPMSSVVIDPIDSALQVGLPLILSAVVIKPHPLAFYVAVALRAGESVVNHTGLDSPLMNALTLKFLPLRAPIAMHDYHHKFSGHAGAVKNLGETLWLWDWLFGTLAKADVRSSPGVLARASAKQ